MCEDICVTVNQTVENILVEVREFSINNVISSDAGNSATTGSDGLLFVPASSSGGVTKTSDLTNDGSDGTSTYVEVDELGAVATSNDYNDLDNLPIIPTPLTNHSDLTLDDGTNPHGTTKADVGLSNVDNTSDLDKPISTATQNALDLNVKKSEAQSFTYPSITGADAVIPLPANGASTIIVNNASLTSIAGFDLSLISGNPSAEVPYIGKKIFVKNLTGNDVIFKNGDSVNADIQLNIKGNTDVIVPNGEIIVFDYDPGGMDEFIRSWETKLTVTATTGSVISFEKNKIYNTSTSPSSANITNDLTNAKLGVVQKIYHNHSTEPTYPAGWVNISPVEYATSELNIIYAEWCGSSRVEYWITQEN